MTERRPIQYAAGSLAVSAFVAVTQILAGATVDGPLHVALVAFAVNIPFQVLLFFMPLPFSLEEAARLRASVRVQDLSRQQKIHCWIFCLLAYLSMPAIVIGFSAMFWHFAWWLGILFALAAFVAYRVYRYCALEWFKHESAP